MKAVRRYVLPILLALMLSASLTPVRALQPPAALSVQLKEVDVSAFPEVRLAVTVRDANGVPVPNLDAQAFEINEDREPEAQTIQAIEAVTDPDQPISLVLVVDVSGSMEGQPLADAQSAAHALVDQLGPEDEVAFLAFSESVDLDSVGAGREITLTTEHEAVGPLIDGLEAEGGTPLYDALYKGVLWAEQATLGHRAVILLTDGVDEGPGSIVASADTPVLEATRANVPIFTIGLGSEIDAGYLQRVARVTGGTYQEAPESAELEATFLNVLERLKQQYVLTYTSPLPADGSTHRVTVSAEVNGRHAGDETELGPLPVVATPTPEPTPEPTALSITSGEGITTTAPITSTGASGGGWGERWQRWRASLGRVAGTILLGLGGLLLLALIITGIVLLAKRRENGSDQEYCMGCGQPLGPNEYCAQCGEEAGRFQWTT